MTDRSVTDAARPALLFDGHCVLCRRSVRWAREHVRADVDYLASHTTDLAALGVSRAETERAVVWVDTDRQLRFGADAIAQLLVHACGPWRLAGGVLKVPPVSLLAGVIYRIVAFLRRSL